MVLYGTAYCPYCVRARALLDAKDVEYDDISLEREPQRRAEMEKLSGRRTVPQIFIDGRHIGGSDDLYALERAGLLDDLLRVESTVDERK